jgi:hypothetical protein
VCEVSAVTPLTTHPYDKPLVWQKTAAGQFYFWAQQVSTEVQLLDTPVEVHLGPQATLSIYKSLGDAELLYQITMGRSPERSLARPQDGPVYLYWTYGTQGGPSSKIKYLFRDKLLSVHSWVDKKAALAVIRSDSFASKDFSFWSR